MIKKSYIKKRVVLFLASYASVITYCLIHCISGFGFPCLLLTKTAIESAIKSGIYLFVLKFRPFIELFIVLLDLDYFKLHEQGNGNQYKSCC